VSDAREKKGKDLGKDEEGVESWLYDVVKLPTGERCPAERVLTRATSQPDPSL